MTANRRIKVLFELLISSACRLSSIRREKKRSSENGCPTVDKMLERGSNASLRTLLIFFSGLV